MHLCISREFEAVPGRRSVHLRFQSRTVFGSPNLPYRGFQFFDQQIYLLQIGFPDPVGHSAPPSYRKTAPMCQNTSRSSLKLVGT